MTFPLQKETPWPADTGRVLSYAPPSRGPRTYMYCLPLFTGESSLSSVSFLLYSVLFYILWIWGWFGDVLRTVVSKRRETDRERVVVVGQHEAFGGNHGGVTDLVA